ncbi:hypothetical protein CVT24_002248 [Panaeolus cyanescens]|uniref:F-box domain-containing protein n=1 Tax=Panaeolus cyanescens TaxID=181874 RepID=A0A409YIF9_9AGAR|nr:hypothetical protein CVT24_002248 [Panaeolus cyanescens]
MAFVVEKTHNIAIPNDIISEIIDILAAERPPDPNAIDLGPDTEWSWPDEDLHDPPGRLQVKKFHTLSSFCLQRARKHIFAAVKLGTNYPQYTCNRPPKHLSTLTSQLAFFEEHKGTLPHIRRLSLDIKQKELVDSSLQEKLYDAMVEMSNLSFLSISLNDLVWAHPGLSSTSKSVQSALRTLLRSSQNLTEVYLRNVFKFRLNDLVDAPYLQGLYVDIDESTFFVDGDKLELNSLKKLIICRIRQPKYFEQFVNVLVDRDGNGNLVLTLPQLKVFEFGIESSSELPEFLKIVNAHGGSLEELSFHLSLDREPGHNDYSTWLNELILPRKQTLQKISISSSLLDESQNPFAGLCSTLLRMDEDNVLAELHIEVHVQTDCNCTLGDEWLEFSRVLDTNKKWKHLRRVTIVVVVADFGRSDRALQTALDGLRNTHLKALFSRPFEFELRVRTVIV